MSEDQIAKAVLRGVRLDEKVPGSGLGLNIVSDLAEAYRGSLIMGRAELGGSPLPSPCPRWPGSSDGAPRRGAPFVPPCWQGGRHPA